MVCAEKMNKCIYKLYNKDMPGGYNKQNARKTQRDNEMP